MKQEKPESNEETEDYVWLISKVKGWFFKPSSYSDPARLADVMALIQVLAQAPHDTIRSETGLQKELQGTPSSKGASTWIDLAESHREFFRVQVDKNNKANRVALIWRHVLDTDEDGKRAPLSPEVTIKLLDLATSLYDREAQRRQRFQYLLPLLAALLAGAFLIGSKLIELAFSQPAK
ncbi:MAG: hypothetical protein QOF62_2978 [Pyrinomonadaceae bacterium]|nr:hypothetical protein [Pyrinomonadaceae bacterium]